MEERVGSCISCGTTIYCENGFLNGSVNQEGGLLCFSCFETVNEDEHQL